MRAPCRLLVNGEAYERVAKLLEFEDLTSLEMAAAACFCASFVLSAEPEPAIPYNVSRCFGNLNSKQSYQLNRQEQ